MATPSKLPWFTEEDVISAWKSEYHAAGTSAMAERFTLPQLVERAEGLMGAGKAHSSVLAAMLRREKFTYVVERGVFYWLFYRKK